MRHADEIREARENLTRFLRDETGRASLTQEVGKQMAAVIMALEWVLAEGEEDEKFTRLLNLLELWAMVRCHGGQAAVK